MTLQSHLPDPFGGIWDSISLNFTSVPSTLKVFTWVIRVLNNEKGKVAEEKEALRWRRDFPNAMVDALRKLGDVVRKLPLVISERRSLENG
ncbi:MAG: hypothetical protein MjAS7_0942 [Metallosphaera javensis (ex Sakai et al. 2022)]|nr:MAG: hypothetical protein MjAS7_0942 [Metallosphaera javensis (ex Sakai et al. 2022)]